MWIFLVLLPGDLPHVEDVLRGLQVLLVRDPEAECVPGPPPTTYLRRRDEASIPTAPAAAAGCCCCETNLTTPT